jgi:tetratricopeptide (TPR) repeat protein
VSRIFELFGQCRTAFLAVLLALTTVGGCDSKDDLERPTNFDEQREASGLHFDQGTARQRAALERAKELLEAGNRQRTQEQLEELARSPQQSEVRARGIVLLAETLAADGDSEAAIEQLRDLEEISPPWGPLYFSLGRIYLKSGNRDAAERAFRDAIRADSTLLRAYVGLASILSEAGRQDEADIVMLKYEREIYRLGRVLKSSSSVNERIELVEVLSQATRDPRVSRVVSQALDSDSREVQLAALEALKKVGTDNAVPALEALIEEAPESRVSDQAREVLRSIQTD